MASGPPLTMRRLPVTGGVLTFQHLIARCQSQILVLEDQEPRLPAWLDASVEERRPKTA
jgi:hypothetical protein